MTKNKQTNLLNAKKNAKSANNPLAASLKAFQSSQDQEKVTYRDYNGEKHTKIVTLADPGIGVATQAIDLMQSGNNTSDFIDLFQLIMDKVIVNPKLSYSSEQHSLPKALKSKTVSHKNNSGAKVSLHYVFPGYRRAVQIVTEAGRPNGALNMTGVLKDLNTYVFKNDDGRAVKNSYWDAGGHASGLGMRAINEAIGYLSDVLDYDGFNSTIQKGLSFLTTKLR